MADAFVYVSCAEAREVAVLALDTRSGALAERAQVSVPGIDGPSPNSMPLAVSPGRRFLYAGLRAEPYPLASYAIDAATGALRLLGSARLADGMCYLAVDATGRALFAPPTAGRNSR